jgi:hypothetical protein
MKNRIKTINWMSWMNRRWVLGLGVFVLTAASYAQWSNPADDVPAYHPAAPLTVSTLPPILAGAKLTGAQFQYLWQKHVYEQVARVGKRGLPTLLQLPLRPGAGAHQPAQLF